MSEVTNLSKEEFYEELKDSEDTTHNAVGCEYIDCVEQLNSCVRHIKDMTHRLKSIEATIIREALFDIESGVEVLNRTLEEEIVDERN